MIFKRTIKTFRNILCVAVFLPAGPYANTISKVDPKEYIDQAKALSAVCKDRGTSGFSGFCLTHEYGPVSYSDLAQTSITLGLEIASFERFYSACEHATFPANDLLVKAKAVLEALKYYDEIKPQEEALSNYVGRFYFCKSKDENDVAASKKLKWFEYMIQKYSAPRKPGE
jgi:hypothetical protein